jgi:hypothetical protein
LKSGTFWLNWRFEATLKPFKKSNEKAAIPVRWQPGRISEGGDGFGHFEIRPEKVREREKGRGGFKFEARIPKHETKLNYLRFK